MFGIFGPNFGPEFKMLDSKQKAAVRKAFAACDASGANSTIDGDDGGEAYAYRNGNRQIAWGYNSGTTGQNIARGLVTPK